MKSYIELINDFWKTAQEFRFTSTEGYLYFYLLSVANRYGWKRDFGLSNRQIMADIDVTKATLIKARSTLIKANLIAYEASNSKRVVSKYSILGYKNYTQCDTQCDTLHKTKIKTKTKIIKKKNIKKKKSEVIKKSHSVETELPLNVEPPKKQKAEVSAPSMEDVIAMCVDKGMSEEEAKKFYYYYDAQGWITTGGQKITRIDSMVNRWIISRKEKENDRNYTTESSKREARNREVFEEIMSHYK